MDRNKGGLFFVYGYGETSKTFIWRTLSAFIGSKGDIVLNVASSGIASLLLLGGRTGHSRFKIPININEDSTCNITVGSPLTLFLVKCKLIIWDKALMMHKHCFESVDRTLQDIMKTGSKNGPFVPFGGKIVVLGGDFRQILPVVSGGSRQEIVDASISSSYLWRYCIVLRLTKNMRLEQCSSSDEAANLKIFSEWISGVGDGKIGSENDGVVEFEIPDDILLHGGVDPLSIIISATFSDFDGTFDDYSYLNGRAILAPRLDMVEEINDHMTSMNKCNGTEFFSSDSTCKGDFGLDALNDATTPKTLNSIKTSELPNHRLLLKVGKPVMLLRNIDHSLGLCNGTRMVLTRVASHVLEARLIYGSNASQTILLPRMTLTPSDNKLSFRLRRRRFPIIVSYAMTINKSQSQSLTNVGLYLRNSVFSHGQLYVAVSRFTN